MTAHMETEAAIRVMETYGASTTSPARVFVAYWREHVQPAVPPVPAGCELVKVDGVPVFRAPTDDDYGWLSSAGGLGLVGLGSMPHPTSPFDGKRYIVRQSVPSEVERLAQALAAYYWAKWGNGPGPDLAAYRVRAQELHDLGVRCPEVTP